MNNIVKREEIQKGIDKPMVVQRNLLEGLAKQGTKPVDNISANLTENEYVIPADVVIALGRGDEQAGIEFLDALVQKVRSQTQGALSNMMMGNK